MGSRHFSTRQEEIEYRLEAKKRAELRLFEETNKRVKFASKIAMVIIDHINDTVIRPGPAAEERECYGMAQELHDLKPELVAIIARIIAVENGDA